MSDEVTRQKHEYPDGVPDDFIQPPQGKVIAELRDWIRAANQFAWAHERTCPRHDADDPCNCGLDAFLSRPRPVIESFRAQLDAANRVRNAVVILLRAKTGDATWAAYPDCIKDAVDAEYEALRLLIREEISRVGWPEPSCQAGRIPRCMCTTCRHERMRSALAADLPRVPVPRVKDCTRDTGHDGPCNGWPCPERRKQMGECEDCGEPATRTSADGVPLCDGDYAEIARAGGEDESDTLVSQRDE
jgi:hypothetical protein